MSLPVCILRKNELNSDKHDYDYFLTFHIAIQETVEMLQDICKQGDVEKRIILQEWKLPYTTEYIGIAVRACLI